MMVNAINSLRKSLLPGRATYVLLAVAIAMASEPAFSQAVFSSPVSFASYAIDANGNLYVWGEDNYLQPIASTMTAQDFVPVKVAFPSGVTSWVSAAAGIFHSLALANNGDVYAWGLNNAGQLGNGTTTNSETPVQVKLPGGVTATAIACGLYHSLALGSDGNVYAWGDNTYGELGNGTTANSDIPIKVNFPSGFVPAKIYAYAYNNYVIGTDGSVYAWGANGQGQFGLGNTTNQLTPVEVPLPSGVTKCVAMYGGYYFSILEGDDGNLYGCGYNNYGQLGDGTTTNSTTFVKANMPAGVTGWKGVACTGSSVLAIAMNDTLYAWGYGGSGEMGNGTGGTAAVNNTIPVEVALPSGVTAKAVAACRFGGLVLGSDNYYYTWGQGTQGQLGNGGNSNSYVPVRVVDLVQVPPGVPNLLSPANADTGVSTSPTLEWNSASEAAGYQLQVSTNPTFTSDLLVNDSTLTDTASTLPGIGTSSIYYWRVRSYNNGVFSDYSASDTFTTVFSPPSAPALLSPADNAVNLPAIDTLVCSKAAGAAKYHWELSADRGFSTYLVNDSTIDTTSVVALSAGQKYYWRVSAINLSGASAFAGPDSFTVMAAPGAAPALLLPANNATSQRADTLVLSWNRVPAASGYECQLSLTPTFTVLVISSDSTADTALTVTSLQNLRKYYWRVLAFNMGGASEFSAIDSFATAIAAPLRPHLLSPFQSAHVTRRVTLTWNASLTATGYSVQVSSDNVFRTTVVDTTVTDTSVQLSVILQPSTDYFWRVAAANAGGISGYSAEGSFTTGTGIDAIDAPNDIPKEFALYQNYPNPFNPATTIQYDVPKESHVTITVYDVTGREVATLVNDNQAAGNYSVVFNGSRFASGMYFFRMVAGNYVKTDKMMMVK
jgi:alpha-tubulin suppressor-like RCC1 family protein